MGYRTLTYSCSDGLARITLNRPKEANTINFAMASELSEVARVVDADATVKAIVLTGSGRFFCAGGDVLEMSQSEDTQASALKRLADELHRAISTFARMRAPLIIAVNGTAAGAGFSMVATGDYVIASDAASFTMAYSNVGLSPDGSSSYYLPRLIGMRRTQDLMYTNRVLSAEEALDWGVVNQVVAADDLDQAANKVAEQFVRASSDSLSAIKKLLLCTFNNSLETQMEIEGRYIAACADGENGREGIKAFTEKRKPNFK